MTMSQDASMARKLRMAFAMGKPVRELPTASAQAHRHPEDVLEPFADRFKGVLMAFMRRINRHLAGTEEAFAPKKMPHSRKVEYRGELVEVSQLARQHGIKPSTLKRRLDMGMSVEEAVERPVDARTSSYRVGAAKRYETLIGNWSAGELSRMTGVGKRTIMGWNYRGMLDWNLAILATCPPFLWGLQSHIRDDQRVYELADLEECIEVSALLRKLSDPALKPFAYEQDTLFLLERIVELPGVIQKGMKAGLLKRLEDWDEYPSYVDLVYRTRGEE